MGKENSLYDDDEKYLETWPMAVAASRTYRRRCSFRLHAKSRVDEIATVYCSLALSDGNSERGQKRNYIYLYDVTSSGQNVATVAKIDYSEYTHVERDALETRCTFGHSSFS